MADVPQEVIKELMKNPERIRNIGVCAHIDHGKCVSKDSRIYQTDGTLITAENFFNTVSKRGIKFEENEEHLIYDLTKENFSVFSLNKEKGSIEKKKVQMAWKLVGGETIKVTLRNKFEITTTPEHKFIVLEENEFKDVAAGDLKLGDRVVCPRKILVDNGLDLKKEFLERLSNKNFYIKLNKLFGEKLKKLVLKKGLKNIQSTVKYKSFYHGLWQHRCHIKDLMNLIKLCKLDVRDVYDNIGWINYRTGKQNGRSSNSMSLPKNFEDFYYLAGLFIGDGTNKKFVVGKQELGKRFLEICKELNIKVTFRNYNNKTPEIATSRTLVEILNSLFDYPLSKKSHNVKISEFLFKSSNKYIAEFLKGYFDTDGCVEKSRCAITLSSASKKMIDDLHLLLLRFGCVSIKEKDNTITISGNSAINFAKQIGFELKQKEEKLKLLVEKINYSYVCDTVQSGTQVMNINRVINNKINNGEFAFIEVSKIEQTYEEEVYDFTVKDNHNFVAEGMFIHNTTFSDNLLFGAGMISEELAGKQLALDFHEDEQERGITIDSANVSMVHSLGDKKYLINLIDTPGHIDFGGEVTRAMRAVDGAIVLCCAVEGIMPQTETVLKQALRERVKPVLFINKVDRLIKEVKLTPEQMQQRFVKIITDVNKLIESIAPPEYKEKWKVSVNEGSVAFGSAYHKWALSVDYMQKKGITFKDVIEAYEKEDPKSLSKKAPLHIIILNMVVKHHPNPVQAQAYRIPKIWHGELESKEGKKLLACDPTGPAVFVVIKIVVDKHAGEIAAGRLFCGTIRQGQEVILNLAKRKVRLQQVSVYKGAQRILFDEIPAGNIIGLVGLKDTFVGETISSEEIEPFEEIKHIFEPVITKSIEATKASDLPRLIEVLRQVGKEDPGVKIEINEETGENLISGMGELHLEIIENRIIKNKGLNVKTSQPIVVYRETILRLSPEIEGKSPNKHNKFHITVEPLADEIYNTIKAGELPSLRIKKKEEGLTEKFVKLFGWDTKEARKIREIYNGNVFMDNTRGIVHIGEVIELVLDGFEQVMNGGPLVRELSMKLLVKLNDCKLHEDAIHRGPAQIYPAIREAIREAMVGGGAILLEPLQILQIEAPADYVGNLSKLVSNKRGQLLGMEQEGEHIRIKAKLPVSEMFGLSSDLRSETGGRGNFFIIDQVFERLPYELQEKVVAKIRQRKGMNE